MIDTLNAPVVIGKIAGQALMGDAESQALLREMGDELKAFVANPAAHISESIREQLAYADALEQAGRRDEADLVRMRVVLENQTMVFGAGGLAASLPRFVSKVVRPGGSNRAQLIDDLVARGIKITPENVVDIRSINGRTIWLERGNSNAGLRHIVGEHGSEFAQQGISEAEIPDVLFTALQRNIVVGYQGRGTGRPIYEFEYGGQTHRLAITVGDNGFVVGANFR